MKSSQTKTYKAAKLIVILSFIAFIVVVLKGKLSDSVVSTTSITEFLLLATCVFFVMAMSLTREYEKTITSKEETNDDV